MIEMKRIWAGYDGRQVLRGVSLQIPDGNVTVLCGPNGCGKSTALRVISRTLEPSDGQVLIDGMDSRQFGSREYARKAAVMPQMRAVAGLTAGSLVLHGRFPYLGYPRRYRKSDLEKVREAMERTGTWRFAESPVAALSGGERQKVYLAMCLAQDTPVLLLDEPTAYLDLSYQLELMRLTRELAAEGKTVFMVIHDLNLAMIYADRIAVMDQGIICQEGTPEEIFQSGVIDRVFRVRMERFFNDRGEAHYHFSERRGE